MVTVCHSCQFAGVNVRVRPSKIVTLSLTPELVTVTSVAGRDESRTRYVA